jgi:hypothetical protein
MVTTEDNFSWESKDSGDAEQVESSSGANCGAAWEDLMHDNR